MPATGSRALAQARASGLLDGPQAVIVMCSGGRDSVCLLDVAIELKGAAAVRALHVNYGLREGADEDERHVRAMCARLGTELDVHHARRPEGEAGNLQAWARDVRYAEGSRLALRDDALLAAGHTASDQVETVLYRLAASPGRRALLGMPAREGRLVRPLLGATRSDTEAHCAARGLDWREDPSNDSDEYARGRVRAGLLPALREIHPAAELSVLRTAQLLREEAAVLDAVVDTALAGRAQIALSKLAELPPALARLIVVRLAEDAAGRLVPQAGERVEQLLGLAAGGGSASLDIGAGVRAVVEYGTLRMSAGSEPLAAPGDVTLTVPGRARFGRWELSCEETGPQAPLGEGVLDGDRLGPVLRVRAWRRGDRMEPLGLGGTRALSDLFIDRRVPRSERGTIPVVESDGVIAWIPGVATSERFRVTDRTRRVAVLSAFAP